MTPAAVPPGDLKRWMAIIEAADALAEEVRLALDPHDRCPLCGMTLKRLMKSARHFQAVKNAD